MLSPYTFEICDTSGAEFTPYEHGGIARQVKMPRTVSFVSTLHVYMCKRLLTDILIEFMKKDISQIDVHNSSQYYVLALNSDTVMF